MKRILFFICLASSFFSANAQDVTYEDLEKEFIAMNSQLPISLGPSMELTSISINRKEATFTFSAVEFYEGLSPLTESEIKESCIAMLSGMDQAMLSMYSLLSNLNIGLCLTYVGETSNKSISVHFTPEELNKITESFSDSFERLELIVKNQKRALPIKAGAGIVFKDIRIINESLEFIYELDETIASIANIKENAAFIKSNTATILTQDFTSILLLALCGECNYCYKMTYVGNSSGAKASIVYDVEEIAEILGIEEDDEEE